MGKEKISDQYSAGAKRMEEPGGSWEGRSEEREGCGTGMAWVRAELGRWRGAPCSQQAARTLESQFEG